jgi:hypothetical protein
LKRIRAHARAILELHLALRAGVHLLGVVQRVVTEQRTLRGKLGIAAGAQARVLIEFARVLLEVHCEFVRLRIRLVAAGIRALVRPFLRVLVHVALEVTELHKRHTTAGLKTSVWLLVCVRGALVHQARSGAFEAPVTV